MATFLKNVFFFLKIYTELYLLFLERGREGERGRETDINVWLPLACPLLGTWPATQACALDWKSNQQLFGLQASSQSTEPHSQGKTKATLRDKDGHYIMI